MYRKSFSLIICQISQICSVISTSLKFVQLLSVLTKIDLFEPEKRTVTQQDQIFANRPQGHWHIHYSL